MAVELAGFVAALCRTSDFRGVEPELVQQLLSPSADQLEVRITAADVDVALVRSGEPFTGLLFVQSGGVVAWQQPYSELPIPFLVGIHEYLLATDRWVATYSATPGTVLVQIPRATMAGLLSSLPSVEKQMLHLALLRISRLYWTSLSITGTPRARVAAALVSRLAIRDEDHGEGRVIDVRQTDLVRLTALSRTAVAAGLQSLLDEGLVELGRRPRARYFTGQVVVPDMDRLKDAAFSDVRPIIKQRSGSEEVT